MHSSLHSHRKSAGSGAAFRHRLVVALLHRRQGLDPSAQGFTLIELMIVVAIVGILSAIALPNYLQARSAALIGARVGEAVGFAKECAVYTVTGIGSTPSGTSSANNGGVVIGGCTGQNQTGTATATWGTASASGVRCLDDTSTTGDVKAVVSVSSAGSLSCQFS